MKKTANYVPKPLLPLREGAAPGGETSVCHNLRPAGIVLKAVGIPEEIHSTGLTPVFTDVMEGETYLFAQEDDGALYVSLSGGKEAARFLGRVEQKVKEGAAAGRFVVFLLADGGCVYVARTSEGYRWMGSLPALPGFGVSVEKGRTLTEKIEAVKFPESLTELTSPAPQGITERAIGAWTDAWKRLCARLRGEGRWIEPVNVRLALRLWDGTLFRVSEPVRVAPPQREGGERVTLTVVADAKGKASGTAEGTLSASGYTIRLSLSGSVPDAWSEVVTGVEVWVSREPESLSGNHNNAAFGHDNQQAYLTFSPPVKGASDIDAEVAEMPYGMLTLLEPATTGIQALRNGTDMIFDSALERYEETMPMADAGADCLLGYGEFLHAAWRDGLYTSMRGNPFVLKSHTAGMGGRVRSLRPQRCGGGAYTRQYIYASTDRGIAALCHDKEGNHTNSRLVGQEPLSHRELWVSTPEGVYALTQTGTLLCIRDFSAPVVFSHLSGVEALLWSNAYRELWIAGTGETKVLTCGHLYTRGESYLPLPGVYSPSLVFAVDAQGVAHIRTLDSERGAAEVRYETETEMPEGSWLRVVTLRLSGREVSYTLSNGLCGTLCSGRVRGTVRDALAVRLALAQDADGLMQGQDSLCVSLSGEVSEIRKISISR